MGMGMHLFSRHVNFEFVKPCWLVLLNYCCWVYMGMGKGEFQNCKHVCLPFPKLQTTCLTFLYMFNPKVFFNAS
jgi:hypothetical protein